jgi:hypothetical protein
MAFKQNTASRNGIANTFRSQFNGTTGSATLTIRTGAPPGPNSAASGTVLSTVLLPATAFASATAGALALSGTWEDTSADNAGTAAHFRIVSEDGSTYICEGAVTITGGGGELEVDNTNFASGQDFKITSFAPVFGAS